MIFFNIFSVLITIFIYLHNVNIVQSFKFDFINSFKNKISSSYIDSNTGYYNLIAPYEINIESTDIFGNDLPTEVTDFAIVAIVKFKYEHPDDNGIDIFQIKIGDFDSSTTLDFYIRRDDNSVSLSIRKHWASANIKFPVSDTKLDDYEWHKIIWKFSNGLSKLWIDCQYVGENKSNENNYEKLEFNSTFRASLMLNEKSIWYQSADFKLKSLELLTDEDVKKVDVENCKDIPSSTKNFSLNVLENLDKKLASVIDTFTFNNSKVFKDEIAKVHKNYIDYPFDQENFVVEYKIRFPFSSKDGDEESPLLNGLYHSLHHTADANGTIRFFLDCEYVGNYTLYNMKKNLNFDDPYSALDTIFDLGLQNEMFVLASLVIHSGESHEESIKKICPDYIEPEEIPLIKCENLKKPFNNLECENKTYGNFEFEAVQTIKNYPNRTFTSEGNVILQLDGLTTFSDELAKDNPNLLVPNFNLNDFSAKYILKLHHNSFDNEPEDESIFNNKWHKISMFKQNGLVEIAYDCEIQFIVNTLNNESGLNDIVYKNLNFGKSESITFIPFNGRYDGFDIDLLKFTIKSPANKTSVVDCSDIKMLNEKNQKVM